MKTKISWKFFAAGLLTAIAVMSLGISAFAASTQQTISAMIGGIRIILDGQELHPTDVNGEPVEPMIYNGTTYLPVRAVASALGKAVSWDGETYTVYLGDMDGQLDYPTVMLKDLTNISAVKPRTTSRLKDNYGNSYSYAITNDPSNNGSTAPSYECLTAMKYSRLKGTLYVPDGTSSEDTVFITITADGREIYVSPQMSKTSEPVNFDVNVTGYNDIKIEFSHKSTFYIGGSGGEFLLCIANAGFYQ